MSGARWERLGALFHAALSRPPEERAAFLDDACADDTALRHEAARLVAAHERAGRFIEEPAIPLAEDSRDDESEGAAIGRRYGPYRVVREIGRGGMGAVYLAERADGQFEQRVAIKLIKRGMDTDLVLRRFRAERQILASLDHPNIARLLDGGTAESGQPFFVMEYIAGEPLDAYADARRLTIAERLRLFLRVASAVAYAHRHLVVHRDIKPVNILVTAEGVPKLLDFGIATVLDPDAGERTSSVTGFRMLTPEYASPEQVDGRRGTPVSDVYSLGVVLYELLTGRSPYRLTSSDPLHVAAAVRTTHPERPSLVVERASSEGRPTVEQARRQLRGDLDTIVLMALRKEPARRYQSVEELADDIERHLAGLPVRARRDGFGYRTAKFVRRNRAAVTAAGLSGAAALLLGAGLVAMRSTASRDGAASPVSARLLAPHDRVLIADFIDRAGDPALAAALSEAFQVDLTQSPLVRVLSPRQVRSALVRMRRPPSLALDDSIAREVAVREGVKALVTGSVSRVAGRYTISAELVSAEKGDLLAALRETAADSNDLIPAIGRLSGRMRSRMGESLPSIDSTPRLEQVTTASIAALRDYSEAVRTINAGDRERGLRMLEEAVAIDTGFASAYRVLGATYGDMVENGRMAAALAHAVANEARLPYYERHHTIASYAYNVQGDYAKAIGAYERILERYPEDVRALNNLAYVHDLRREYAAEESLAVRAASVDSTMPILRMAVFGGRLGQGDFDGARRALDDVEARAPGYFNARLAEIYLAAARQDWDAAERFARERLASTTAVDSLDGLETLAGIVMMRGRLGEAARYSRMVLALAARLDSPGRFLSSAMRLARIALGYRHDSTAALRAIDAALARFPLDSIDEGDRPYDDLARVYAAAGRPERARELIARAERSTLGRISRASPNRRWSLGAIALAEGRVREAEPELRVAADSVECTICALPDLARAYEAAGLPDSAIATYERYVRTPWKWRFEPDAIDLGWTLVRLGALYDARGDRAKSAHAYTRLLELWRRADAALAPTLAEARKRLGDT